MFNVGDAVVYGSSGVCKIDDIRNEYFLGEKALYYILSPVYSKGSTIFCPVNNNRLPIRPISTKKQLADSLSGQTIKAEEWIENDQKRHERFNEILHSSDCGELAEMIRILYKDRAKKESSRKKFRAADEKALADAEKVLFGEIAYVLGIDYEEAGNMFRTATEAMQ